MQKESHLQSLLARDAQVVSELLLDAGLLQQRRNLRPGSGDDHEPRLHVVRPFDSIRFEFDRAEYGHVKSHRDR